MFENLRFQTRFFRARLKEIGGDCQAAADLLDGCVVPDRFLSLRDAYRVRMLVLAHPLTLGPDIATAAQAFPWFQSPSSVSDRYARDYCLYIASAVRGDVAMRKKLAAELGRLRVKSVYRNALKVT